MDWIDVDPKTVMNTRRREKLAREFLAEMVVGKAVPVDQLLHTVSTLQSVACSLRAREEYREALWRVFTHADGKQYFMRTQ